jgi:hypothetical protein
MVWAVQCGEEKGSTLVVQRPPRAQPPQQQSHSSRSPCSPGGTYTSMPSYTRLPTGLPPCGDLCEGFLSALPAPVGVTRIERVRLSDLGRERERRPVWFGRSVGMHSRLLRFLCPPPASELSRHTLCRVVSLTTRSPSSVIAVKCCTRRDCRFSHNTELGFEWMQVNASCYNTPC